MSGIICDTVKTLPVVVLDTNVLVSALRSRYGASFELLNALLDERFVTVVSVPLVMEYESVLHREGVVPIAAPQIDAVIDMICATARLQEIHFLWRPRLRDPKDEMVLEAAVNADADFLVTHNLRDFEPAKRFNVKPIGPRAFLNYLESRKL
jgi:putative PIN family toxin of toxin-antitoxin system